MIALWKIKHGMFVKRRGVELLPKTIRKMYRCWVSMRSRCYDSGSKYYPGYGARGIKVCRRWRKSFAYFVADMGKPPTKKHSIGRIHNDQGYRPSNCRWETCKQQQANRRGSRLIRIGHETQCGAEWARRAGITATAFLDRVNKGRTGKSLLLPRWKR